MLYVMDSLSFIVMVAVVAGEYDEDDMPQTSISI